MTPRLQLLSLRSRNRSLNRDVLSTSLVVMNYSFELVIIQSKSNYVVRILKQISLFVIRLRKGTDFRFYSFNKTKNKC